MWRGRVGGKGEGQRAGGWGDATSTRCAPSPTPMLQHPTFP